VSSLEIKISHGLLILYAKVVWSICATGQLESCLKFGVSMVWREPKNHFNDCYFRIVNIIGIIQNNRDKWSYPDLPSARRRVPHSDLVPVPPFCELPQLSEDESCMSDIAQGFRQDCACLLRKAHFTIPV
jgi:hypothetical protein